MLAVALQFCAAGFNVLERLSLGNEQAKQLIASPDRPAIRTWLDKKHCWNSAFDHLSP